MKLTGKEKVSYGLGAIGKDMVYMFSASYILYYYQDILGVSAIAMGIILMAARVFDAFNDPIMGIIVAKTRTKWGKFRPWLFIGTLTNALVLYLMFAAPPTLDGNGLVAYAAITYILWGVTDGYSILVNDSCLYRWWKRKRIFVDFSSIFSGCWLRYCYNHYHEMCLSIRTWQ